MNAVQPQVVSEPLPASRKVYKGGSLHPDIRVPMREISLHPSAGESALTVYDSSGPYTDQAIKINIEHGLRRLREDWILRRGDVEAHGGRLRARAGAAPTQLAYARAGIITPEMEFVAIRENVGIERQWVRGMATL